MQIARPTEARSSAITTEPLAAPSVPAARRADEPSFARVLGSLGREIDRGEAVSSRALRGGDGLSASDLLALQAGIYRYSEAVELSTKLVDRATSAVKTTLQSQ